MSHLKLVKQSTIDQVVHQTHHEYPKKLIVTRYFKLYKYKYSMFTFNTLNPGLLINLGKYALKLG